MADSDFDATPLDSQLVRRKLEEYQNYVDSQLRSSLQSVFNKAKKIETELEEYRILRNQIDAIKATKGGQFKTLVDVGCNFYLQAKVSDTNFILIDIGCGYYAQMTMQEALKFIQKKETELTGKLSGYAEDATKIQKQIYLMMETIRNLRSTI